MTPAYKALTATPHTVDSDILTTLNALAQAGNRHYSTVLLRVDKAGNQLEDLTPYLAADVVPEVSRDCATECSGKLTFGLSKALQWGSDLVQPWQLISAPGYLAGAWQSFPLGVYVATSPGFDNLDHSDIFKATGWDRLYLLQSDHNVSFSFAAGSTYLAALTAVIKAAGLITATLSEICNVPGTWATKILTTPSQYPLGDGKSHLQIVNEMLKASGQQPMYSDRLGRFQITDLFTPATQAYRWRWQLGDFADGSIAPGVTAYPDRMIATYAGSSYNGDVYNVPNRWIFVQDGLTFKPTEGSGQYTVNNTSTPPADQGTVGRVVTSVQTLQASGQADLKAQGDAIVTAALADVEKVSVTTCPWPAAAHFDVFSVAHPSLPGTPNRRVQAQTWTMPLNGDDMTWQTSVVSRF